MTVTARLNGVEVARSDRTVIVEGNHYFPPDDVRWDLLTPTSRTSVCPWKGTASYWSVRGGDEVAEDAAWAYPTPKDAAAEIRDHVAFWRGVVVREES
ncbi:DUF427 domain-containing protein [Actinotalea sp. K2]|uniref:DUF427 domain-containing protein n=1 Tax=Actinotalea sp. K2 TaxID=2939438 RepID=UPI002017DD23|nr:DUF427 domain-containing protein [Actinotalea sp. K2]MCL3860966.1 DUF427 domain-containing protein [Actinotalea sp. K2]